MKKSHIFDKSILKQYDIRGVVGKNLGDEDAYYVGRSYGTLLRRKYAKNSCVVGYDGRHTSKKYAQEAINGLMECGIDVVNIGLVPTPMIYFAIRHLKRGAGLMITASHNPSEYNGFKMLTSEEPVFGDDIQQLGVYAANADYEEEKLGSYEETSVKSTYFEFILSVLKLGKNKNLKVMWDAGNGAVASILKDIVARFPGQHLTICDTVDGNFPAHHPDPAVEKNMEMLKKGVVDNKCDFGVGFDGDGDRIGIVDNEGFLLYGDQLLAILAREFLKNNPGEKIMSEVKASKVLYDDIVANGGIPVMWKPGHSAQKFKMKSDNIKLAAETSGHVYYGENYNYDDAMYAAVKMMNFVSNSDKSIADIRKSFPKTYSTSEIRVEVGDDKKFKIVQEITERIRKEGGKFVDVDGLRVETEDGWWLARGSNTQPDITTRCEALSEKGFEKCKADLRRQLKLSGYDIKFDD
ncbi:MAG: phosphomannomutase/phosphoglucomutase [Rickettsiales bacterium]|jgi:phosphomannomutase|nr:phosphomannomutase/phosphoglucomutase [Rickettsiales bacterium]